MALPDNLVSPDMIRDPYPGLAALREQDPVHWSERHRSWVITRFDDVRAGLRDARLSSDRITPYVERTTGNRQAEDPVFSMLQRWLVFLDPPDHTRLRKLVARAFMYRSVQQLATDVEDLVDEILAGLDGSGFELVSDFAYPLPATVIARMLGVPPTDRDRFKHWSDEISSLVFGAFDNPDRHAKAERGMIELTEYLRRLVEVARATGDRDTLLGALVGAQEDEQQLSVDEVVATCTLILFGGHETTTNLIANGSLALMNHPEQWQRLRDEPDIATSAIEELLRYDGPAKVTVRTVGQDLTIRGRELRQGQRVFLVHASANRDPEHFLQPDELDLARSDNDHVGFGFGLHYCLGAHLARLEARVALTRLTARFPGLKIASGDLEWHPTLLSRGLRHLPVSA